jgi:hypothetical protein
MLNVNEFSEAEETPSNRCVKIGKLTNNRRVLKALPITKESFMNWHKQSVLKSFATSQEASFVSNKPTERIDSSRINKSSTNPSAMIQYEQKQEKMEVLNKTRNLHNYNGKSEESPGQLSTVFIDESSLFFEEFAHHSHNRDPSKASNRQESGNKNMQAQRREKLHNCTKVLDYQFLKAHTAKDSVVVSRNEGDTDLVLKETIDYIEQPS